MIVTGAPLYNSLVEDLTRDEGKRSTVYQDSGGILTIGIGRNLESRGLSDEEIAILLGNDIEIVTADLDRNVPWWREMPLGKQRALANMCFNLGWPRLSKFHNMLYALENDMWEEAANQAMDSRWADQVGDRADRIAELFMEE